MTAVRHLEPISISSDVKKIGRDVNQVDSFHDFNNSTLPKYSTYPNMNLRYSFLIDSFKPLVEKWSIVPVGKGL
jgi:hypothetical protein